MSLTVAPVATPLELRLEPLRSGYHPVVRDVRHTTRAVEVGRRDTGQAKQATLGVRVFAAVTGACEAHLRHGGRSRRGGVFAAISWLHGALRTPFPGTVQHELRGVSVLSTSRQFWLGARLLVTTFHQEDDDMFLRTIPPSEAQGPVREMYQQAARRFGYVPNWAQAFSLRPGVRDGWAALLTSIQSNLPGRTYELATLAAARALRSSYCALAHGSVLADKVFDPKAVTAIMKDADQAPLEPRERHMMAFVDKVVLNGDRITSADIELLRSRGYQDEDIFDIAATAAARCFLSKLLDALGVQADSSFNDLDPALRDALTVGRPVAHE